MPIRCQVVLNHISGLPRDNITNTFHFRAGAQPVTEADAEDIAEAVVNFYKVAAATQTKPLMSWLGLSVTTDAHAVKVTFLDEATGVDERGLGFPPLWTEAFTFTGRVVDPDPVPSEVALCLSMKNMASGTVPPAQRRGRIYFGPVGQTAIQAADSFARPVAALQTDLIKAANKLQDDAAALGHALAVYSRPFEGRAETPRPGNPRGPLPALAARPGALYDVTDFWVDNSFDSIRKRGERATTRVTG